MNFVISHKSKKIDLIIGDEAGNVLRWDIRTNQANQLVGYFNFI